MFIVTPGVLITAFHDQFRLSIDIIQERICEFQQQQRSYSFLVALSLNVYRTNMPLQTFVVPLANV